MLPKIKKIGKPNEAILFFWRKFTLIDVEKCRRKRIASRYLNILLLYTSKAFGTVVRPKSLVVIYSDMK